MRRWAGEILQHHLPQLVLRVINIPLPVFSGHKKKHAIKVLQGLGTLTA